ncbi:MAG: (d)CMP kinase [Acutalibacteraceae bacterium]|nr:(d)CMP kinase [Clostridia bacterium]MEE1330179.1 (d)CMP kinase [Acutalibacteraceae bacterium]
MTAVAIDGPAGAGKSSVARAAAKRLGYIYVDTGALYRAVGLKFLKSGADTTLNCDIQSVLDNTVVEIKFINGEQRVMLDGNDVSDEIRTPEASKMASAVSAKPQVRAFLLEMQRKAAADNNVIMDGRDIATVVLPDAEVKIYLTASAEVRAERRYKELIEKGADVSLDEVLSDIINRDNADMNREIAPLKKADDAVLADTSDCSFDESVELIVGIIKERVE